MLKIFYIHRKKIDKKKDNLTKSLKIKKLSRNSLVSVTNQEKKNIYIFK